jgi:chloramphenicol 3-O phosphotransferase
MFHVKFFNFQIKMSKIIFLNGSSSSGKTSIAKAIQHIADVPFIRIGVDTFIDMMPRRYLSFGDKSKEGCWFEKDHNNDGPVVRCNSGHFGNLVFLTAINVIKLMADSGLNLVIDEVIWDESRINDYKNSLTKHDIIFVKIFCSKKTSQEREILRGDREIGLANDQSDKIKKMKFKYDLVINTENIFPFESAQRILKILR